MILRPRQSIFVDRSVTALQEHGNTLGVAPTGCHAKGTSILMYNGSIKNVEDILVGDQIMGPDSQPRNVIELHRGEDDMFEIRPLKGETFIVNAGHILSLVKTSEGRIGSHAWSKPGGCVVNIGLANYMNSNPYFKHLYKLYRTGVDFPVTDVPGLDPYFLGLLLGDGALKYGTPSITTMDCEVIEYCYVMAKHLGIGIREEQLIGNEANTYHFSNHNSNYPNPLTVQLRELGVAGCRSDEKFIPHIYKIGSRETRAAILAGLIDTDGHLTKNYIEFSSASMQMAEDVAFIARSLGFMALPKQKKVNGKTYYRFGICGDFSEIPIRVARRKPESRQQKKNQLRTGFTVHAVGRGDYFGFTVDSDNLYLMGDFTVTHNSGKTIMLSAVIGRMLAKNSCKAVVLAHRDELTDQNRSKFSRVNPGITTSVVDANTKSWHGRTTFAMVQTLCRPNNLRNMPLIDLLVIDEAHHAISDSYKRIIENVLTNNSECKIYGVTATPNRGDKRGLRPIFSNVADQIRLGELIASGHLVKPKTFVIDVGTQEELKNVDRSANDFDMSQVAAIMNTKPINEAVVKHWKERAGDRKTVIFCSTVDHAYDVQKTFLNSDVHAEIIHGELSTEERKAALNAFQNGTAEVIVNVAVLTEGWDHTPTSCVILLRPSSYKSTMIQMIGRGLRTVDPNEYPGVIKTDCIVLDFGTSTLMHGSLEQDVNLDDVEPGESPKKECPSCNASVPISVKECPICGYTWPPKEDGEQTEKEILTDFILTEIDLFKRSSFLFVDLFRDDCSIMATGFKSWAGAFYYNGKWYAVGRSDNDKTRLLAIGERMVCLAAADDYLNEHETDESAHKTRSWIHQPPTDKQLQYLPESMRNDYGLTRYQASAMLNFKFNKQHIQQLIMQ